ncbi:MAG TPA: pyridoxamine 5'-phosphate oxidase [Patescibacteria group bacterium]|nr:pyridoxamine 5'-phosphate oxidase [Patescibacteria group bacterium]
MDILRDQDPIELFHEWIAEAAQTEPNDPEATALATVSADGQPSVRMVLMKGVDDQGFRFYTNLESRKSGELLHNPKAAMVFHWKTMRRQVRVEGTVSQTPAWAVDAYFKTRHVLSRLGAWASRQSQPLESREELEGRVKEYAQKFKGQDIPRPPHWGGFILKPARIEFWQEGEGRLHDRFVFSRNGDGWDLTRLNP